MIKDKTGAYMQSESRRYPLPFRTTILVTLVSTSLSGCQSVNQAGDSVGRTTLGCIGGSLLGAGVGALLDGSKGAIKGAVIGLGVGCIAGYAWDEHEKELRKLAQEENMRIEIERVYTEQGAELQAKRNATDKTKQQETKPQTVGLVAQVADEAMFDVGSANLTEAGQRQLDKLAELFFKNRQMNNQQSSPILVIGHTDATGSADFNQQLSEQRAKKVVQILAARGITAEHLYYQGAGEGRPIADNSSEAGRSANRRVELVELQDDSMLAKRIAAEQQNPRYIQHGTGNRDSGQKTSAISTSKKTAIPQQRSSTVTTSSSSTKGRDRKKSPSNQELATSGKSSHKQIDFGGKPVSSRWELTASFTPDYSSGFGLISSAVAHEVPLASCNQDAPRVIGEVKNLAGKPIESHKTVDYLPGMNGKVWAAKVNGHVIYINPVAVLKEDGQVARQPQIAITENYDKGQRKITGAYPAMATTYRGKNNLLMRIFINDTKAPLQCLDVLLPYGGSQSQQGVLYYDNATSEYVVDYKPRNTSI